MLRSPALGLLSALLVAPAMASGRQCGDDVRGRVVPCDCGDVLVGSRTLGDDDPITSRVCPGTGLLVAVSAGQPAATLALAGHAIAGSGLGVGIQVVGGGVGGLTISGPGGVRGFGTGVQAVNGALAALVDVIAADNTNDGFSIAGVGFTLNGCQATRNGRNGFVVRGRGYQLDGNRALDNGHSGFELAGHDGAVGNTLGNEAAGNARDGLHVRGRGHDIRHPVVTANGGRGISAHFAEGRIAGAVASANRGHGLRAGGGDLAVSGNEAHDNGAGIDVRGARVRDGGGNRAEDCRVGSACR
jgi:hypothetical protein